MKFHLRTGTITDSKRFIFYFSKMNSPYVERIFFPKYEAYKSYYVRTGTVYFLMWIFLSSDKEKLWYVILPETIQWYYYYLSMMSFSCALILTKCLLNSNPSPCKNNIGIKVSLPLLSRSPRIRPLGFWRLKGAHHIDDFSSILCGQYSGRKWVGLGFGSGQFFYVQQGSTWSFGFEEKMINFAE